MTALVQSETRVFYAGRMRTLEAIERRRRLNREWSSRMWATDSEYRKRRNEQASERYWRRQSEEWARQREWWALKKRLDKLVALADHPSTPEAEAAVARGMAEATLERLKAFAHTHYEEAMMQVYDAVQAAMYEDIT